MVQSERYETFWTVKGVYPSMFTQFSTVGTYFLVMWELGYWMSINSRDQQNWNGGVVVFLLNLSNNTLSCGWEDTHIERKVDDTECDQQFGSWRWRVLVGPSSEVRHWLCCSLQHWESGMHARNTLLLVLSQSLTMNYFQQESFVWVEYSAHRIYYVLQGASSTC
jgi:hypothetical protein